MKIPHQIVEIINWGRDQWYRYRLRNKDFTIITDTCIAGIMYHRLGMQFASPTINLWMYDKDFYKFVHNLKYYISQELRFVKTEGERTPTAYLGDILIHFNHYHSEQEAAAKWYERCQRINWDNLFIICADGPVGLNAVTDEEIRSLREVPCRGRVVFTPRKIDGVDYTVKLPTMEKDGMVFTGGYMFDKDKYGTFFWEKKWDWVHWLNTGEVRLKIKD